MSDCNSGGSTPATGQQLQAPNGAPSSSASASFIDHCDLFNRPPREEVADDETKAVPESTSMAIPLSTGNDVDALTQQKRSKSMVVQTSMAKPQIDDSSGDSSQTQEKKIAATKTDETSSEKRAKSCPAINFDQESLSAAAESDNEMSTAELTNDGDDCQMAVNFAMATDAADASHKYSEASESEPRSTMSFKNTEDDQNNGYADIAAAASRREASTLAAATSDILIAGNHCLQDGHISSDENDSADENSDDDEIAPIAVLTETRFQRQIQYGRRSLPSSSSSLAAAAAAAAASLHGNGHDYGGSNSAEEAETTSSLDSFLDQLQLDLQQYQNQPGQQGDDHNDRSRLSSLFMHNRHLMNSSNDLVNVGGRRRYSLPTPPQLNATATLFPQSTSHQQRSSFRSSSSRRNSYESRMNSSSSSLLDQLQNLNVQEALLEQQEADREEARASAAAENDSNEDNTNSGPSGSTVATLNHSSNHPLFEQDAHQTQRNNLRRSSFSDRFRMSSSSTAFFGNNGAPAAMRQYSSERNLMSPSLQLREVFTAPSLSTTSFTSGQVGAERITSVSASMANTNFAASATTTQGKTARGHHCGSSPLYHAVASNAPLHTIQQIINTMPTSQTGQPNNGGLTPLHCGIERYDTPTEVLHVLLKSNPSMASMKSNKGDTPVDLLWKRFADPEDYRSTEIKKKAKLVRHLMESVVSDDDDEDDNAEQDKSFPFRKKTLRRKRKAQTLLRSYRNLREFWDIMVLTIKAACLGVISDDDHSQTEYINVQSNGASNKSKWRLLRGAISLHCPGLLIQFASALHPEQLIERDEDQRGRLPLHMAAMTSATAAARAEDRAIAAARVASRLRGMSLQQPPSNVSSSLSGPSNNNGEATIIQALLSTYPEAASCHDYDGRLPINLALESHHMCSSQNSITPPSSLWDGCIRGLFMSCPQSLSTRDTKTHMMPFMIAAMGNNADINCIFRLLREGPIEALR